MADDVGEKKMSTEKGGGCRNSSTTWTHKSVGTLLS